MELTGLKKPQYALNCVVTCWFESFSNLIAGFSTACTTRKQPNRSFDDKKQMAAVPVGCCCGNREFSVTTTN